MKVIKFQEIPEEQISSKLMTSGKVTLQAINLPKSCKLIMKKVNFDKGVRNKFHIHSSDQILIITGGKGIVATEKEESVVVSGDIVHFSAMEKHWHGATSDSRFSHIFITEAGYTTQLVEI